VTLESARNFESAQTIRRAWLVTIACAAAAVLAFLYARAWTGFGSMVTTAILAFIAVLVLINAIAVSLGLTPQDDLHPVIMQPPPEPGGSLTASVQLRKPGRGAQVDAELICWRLGADSAERVWSGRQTLMAKKSTRGAFAHVSIAIPAGLPAAGPEHRWELRLSAESADLSVKGSYLVRVAPGQGAPAGGTLPGAAGNRSALWLLMAVNLAPLAGVLLWDWRVQDVVVLYWIETVIVGALNVLRILGRTPDVEAILARGRAVPTALQEGPSLRLLQVAAATMYVVHFGVFCCLLGWILTEIFRIRGLPMEILARTLHDRPMLFAILAIAASHVYTFLRNYIGKREYRQVDPGEVELRSYRRIGLLMAFIMLGALALTVFDSPLVLIALFVALKMRIDWLAQTEERWALGPGGD